MELILLVYSAPWIETLPVSTIISEKDQAADVLDTILVDEGFAESPWFTDGSLLEGRAGGAAIRLARGKQQDRILLPLGEGQVMESEVESLSWANKSAEAAGHSHISVVSDSQDGLKGGTLHGVQYEQLLRHAFGWGLYTGPIFVCGSRVCPS
ncbi:hypothetical protein B0H14DRAFT_3139452 [Mycena olivaceomarginata]|nr:hypothetical protein B0H14DRAFT_3139452 [Mycena olivaceomarginata]